MKRLVIVFALLTIINLIIFFERDHFEFIKYSTYNELYQPCNEECINKWKTMLRAYPSSEITGAKNITNPVVHDSTSTLAKVKAIGHFLYARFHQQTGDPQPIIHQSDPVEQYNILSSDTSQKLWCGTYAQMFSFFCWSQNIACRNIEIMRPGDHHLFNECYLPESNQWVMVDLTNGILLAQKDNQLLNGQSFITAISNHQPFSVLDADNEAWKSFSAFERAGAVQNYYQPQFVYYYYHTIRTNEAYSAIGKLKHYLWPTYWYEIFSSNRTTSYLFYLKQVFLLLWLINFGIIIIKLLIK